MQDSSLSKSLLFVAVQFISLGLIAITGPLFPSNAVLLVIEILGISLGVWAILTMRIGNFHIAPDPLRWTRLVTSGPYRLIRHPMYLAILITTLPLVINDFDVFRLAIWSLLLIDLILKLNYEEKILAAELVGYDSYMQQSARLIPFVY